MNESINLIVVVLAITWFLFPFLVLRALWNLQKETDATHDTHKMALLKLTGIQDQQKRTNELLEWLGQIQQAHAADPSP